MSTTTVPKLLEAHPSDSPAVIVPGGTTATYGELLSHADAVRRALQAAGVDAGDVVTMVLGNDLTFVETFLGIAMAGATAAPLNPAYTAGEFQGFMTDARPRLLVASPDAGEAQKAASALRLTIVEAARDGASTRLSSQGSTASGQGTASKDASLPVLFLHTSGTTSRPKGVPLTHANLAASAANVVATYNLGPSDRALCVMPLFHVHGLVGVLLSTLASGGAVVLPSRFSAGSFWTDARANQATWYSAAPTIHQILLARAGQEEAPRGTFRFIRSCSAALAPATLAQLESRFEAPVVEAYGMTEAAHQMSSNPLPPDERRPGTVGAGTGVDVAVMDEAGTLLPEGTAGEVVARGPNVMTGYRDNPEANASAFTRGWFRTGDQGIVEGSYLRLTGRLKEIINRGGEKISPLEVDAVLAAHPAVAEAVSFGVPDAKYGEEVHAAVVLRAPATPDDLQAFAAERLAAFKVPKAIHVLDELPKTATGKVQRRHVAAQFS